MDTSSFMTAYDHIGEAGELFIMLLVAFVLGALFGRLLARSAFESALYKRHEPIRDTQPEPSSVIELYASVVPEDFSIIEGIGSRTSDLLHKRGIRTFADLARTPVARLEQILREAGGQFTRNDPAKWPERAQQIIDERIGNKPRA